MQVKFWIHKPSTDGYSFRTDNSTLNLNISLVKIFYVWLYITLRFSLSNDLVLTGGA